MTIKNKRSAVLRKINDLRVDLEFESRIGNFRIARELDQLICKLEKKISQIDSA